MTNLYIIFMTTLVALVSFHISIPYLNEILLLILGWYCLSSYFDWVQLSTGLVDSELSKDISWEAVLIGLVYVTGVALTYSAYPLAAMFMAPWAIHMLVVNAFAIAYAKDWIDISEADDDEDEEG